MHLINTWRLLEQNLIVCKFYLLSSSNDEDPTKDKALSQNISHEAPLKGPQAVHPNANTQERHETQLPLTGPIKTPLQCKHTNQNPWIIHSYLSWFTADPEWLSFKRIWKKKKNLSIGGNWPRFSHWFIRQGKHNSPFHPRRSPPWSTVWSSGPRCWHPPSPQRTEGPRAHPAGASERTALQPPAASDINMKQSDCSRCTYCKHK